MKRTATLRRLLHGQQLTDVELQTLQGIARGETIEETARLLCNAVDTLKSRRRSIYAKLGARTPAHAVALAYETGILPSQHP